METILIRYISKDIEEIKEIKGGDWYDLRCAENIKLSKGDWKLISLGIAMQLPEGYEAHVVPRSSTFKNWGILQVNSVGIIDNSYCGNNDEWMMCVYATRDTELHINDRICQFRIVKKQPEIEFDKVMFLDNPDRNGIGSTGVN